MITAWFPVPGDGSGGGAADPPGNRHIELGIR
jgi:hypothetical protein